MSSCWSPARRSVELRERIGHKLLLLPGVTGLVINETD